MQITRTQYLLFNIDKSIIIVSNHPEQLRILSLLLEFIVGDYVARLSIIQ